MAAPASYLAYCRGGSALGKALGLASLFLNPSDNLASYIELKKVTLLPPSPVTGAGSGTSSVTIPRPGLVKLSRISAYTGGTVVAAVKSTGASSNLPSQVTCVSNPDAVTAGSTIRERAVCPQRRSVIPFSLMSALISPGEGIHGSTEKGGGIDPAELFRVNLGSAIQSIILREGEGISLVLSQAAMPCLVPYEIVVTNDADGSTYHFSDPSAFMPSFAGGVFALLNGSGSGVVLRVAIMKWPEIYDGNVSIENAIVGSWAPNGQYAGLGFECRLTQIDGYTGGVSVTPAAMDSSNPALSTVEVRKGPITLQTGLRAGLEQDVAQNLPGGDTNVLTLGGFWSNQMRRVGLLRRRIWNMEQQDVGGTVSPLPSQEASVLFRVKPGQQGIILRPGQGVAIAAGASQFAAGLLTPGASISNSVFAIFDVVFEFAYVPATVAASGVSRSRIFARS